MRCADIMTGNPQCCVPSDTVAEAAKVMKSGDIGALPVCEDGPGGRLVGIVTDRDLVVHVMAEARSPASTRVRDIMTREPLACQAGDDIETAFDSMRLFQVRRIPVVGAEGELLGIISQAD